MENFAKIVGVFVLAVAMVFGIGLLLSLPVMWIVNGIFSTQLILFVFGTAKIGFWTAYCVSVLCGLLFKATSSSKD